MVTIKTCGIDVGYSDVKACVIDNQRGEKMSQMPSLFIQSSAAAPHFDELDSDRIQIQVGSSWFLMGESLIGDNAAVRNGSNDYYRSPEYQALTLGMLARICAEADATAIERLVVGLPVSAAVKQTNRQFLIDQLTGEHQIPFDASGKLFGVTVRRVSVLPQPLGAFIFYMSKQPTPRKPPRSSVVIDIGNGTTDFLMMEGATPQMSSSFSIPRGMQSVKQQIAIALALEGFAGASAQGVERILTRGSARMGSSRITVDDIKPYLLNALYGLATEIGAEVSRFDCDIALITGGASPAIEASLQARLQGVKVSRVSDSISAFDNARGFAIFGEIARN